MVIKKSKELKIMSTITFKDYQYVRPDLEKVKQKFEETIAILSDDNPKVD